jgi:hypothetical protein
VRKIWSLGIPDSRIESPMIVSVPIYISKDCLEENGYWIDDPHRTMLLHRYVCNPAIVVYSFESTIEKPDRHKHTFKADMR